MTIVIPYKDEVQKGLELKYALRSIEKNLSGWDRVVFIGCDFPGWLDIMECAFILMADIDGYKERSIYQKLLAACNSEMVSENFIYWNDDHFLLKPLHVSEIKYWHSGPLARRNVYNRERIKQENTLEFFSAELHPHVCNYDIHTPIIFNKQLFKEIFTPQQQELCIKSLYCNLMPIDINKDYNKFEFMEDCKIVGHFSKEEVKKKIEGRLFFSTNAICNETVEVLEELFPEKSKFEL